MGKTPFYNPRHLVTIFISILVVYVGINYFYYLIQGGRQASTQPAVIADDTRYQQTIDRAQKYFFGPIVTIESAQGLMLDYLYRQYRISEEFNADVSPVMNTETDPVSQQEIAALMRIAYPDSLATGLGQSPSVSAVAANCDHIPPANDFTARMQSDLDKGGYEASHVALGLRIMSNLGCQLPTNAAAMEAQAIRSMKQNIQDPETLADLRYESLAFLSLLGRQNEIQQEWIDQLIAEQNNDGGWRRGLTDNLSDQHATMLALWAVLGYANPQANGEPVIHPPDRSQL